MMTGFRTTPPATLGGEAVVEVRDHLEGWNGMPASNVVQFLTEQGALVTARPSGTEPKIKFYFSVRGEWLEGTSYDDAWQVLGDLIAAMGRDLGVEIAN